MVSLIIEKVGNGQMLNLVCMRVCEQADIFGFFPFLVRSGSHLVNWDSAGNVSCGEQGFALVLLGTWPAILALLERRGRLPQHTYLDYSFTNFLTAVTIALTLGQIEQLLGLVGLSVTEVITSSIAVLLGTTVNYFLDDWINRAESSSQKLDVSLLLCLGAAVSFFEYS